MLEGVNAAGPSSVGRVSAAVERGDFPRIDDP
jgi:hypothetical protein